LPEVTFEAHALADRSSPARTQETREVHEPKPTKILTKTSALSHPYLPLQLPYTNQLHRVNLLTGEQSYIKYLSTSSRMAVNGLSCLEEA
jgi:hypothetical protein